MSGQINNASPVDEVDVSRALRLNDTFLDAQPTNDSSFQEVLVDGSTITVTNSLMNGELTLQALRTTGLVGTGDFIAAAHLIIASKDDVGGTFTVVETINGKRVVTLFYGISFKRVPHLRKAGNAVVPYPVVMLYAGWLQGVTANMDVNTKTIWAIGNKHGIKSVYSPYAIQESENPNDYFGGTPLSDAMAGVAGMGDSASGDLDALAEVPDPLAPGMSDTPAPATVTWPSS